MTGRPPHRLQAGGLHLFRLDADGAPHIDRLNLTLAEA